MSPAVEYLESDYLYDAQRCVGVTAVRPMFELIDDHEAAMGNSCYMCDLADPE